MTKRVLFPLLAAPLLAGAVLTAQASAAPTRPSIQVRVTLHRGTLHVTGSGFAPGDRIQLGVINTESWQLLAKGTTRSEEATYQCPQSAYWRCGQADPAAGRISFRQELPRVSVHAALALFYRSSRDLGVQQIGVK